MISIKCPHCQVGLKVDEGKIPLGITSFKCPGCKQPIPVSLVKEKSTAETDDSETVLVNPIKGDTGKITVIPASGTPQQSFILPVGISVIGRNSSASNATIKIETDDRSMSREHIRIEVKKDIHGRYKHLLSDNNSKNHTLYNSNYLEDGEIVVLNDNDEIQIGHTVIRFQI